MEAFSHADWCLAQAIHWDHFGGVWGARKASEGQGFFGVDVYFFFPPCVATPKKFWNSLDFTRFFFKKIGTYFSATLRNRGIGIYFSATFWGRETQVYSWFSL